MTIQARVLMLAKKQDSEQASEQDCFGRLGQDLDRLGWRTITTSDSDAALACVSDLQIEAILIDSAHPAATPEGLSLLRSACAPRRLPVLQLAHSRDFDLPDGWDMVFDYDAHAQQIALSLEHIVRANVAQEEYDLRLKTLAAQNIPLPAPPEDRPLSVLSVGPPAPDFLALSHHMRAKGAEVLAAFSSYSAFDYLHDRAFDAVVLWGTDSVSEPLSIATGMRRNTRLYHMPVFLRLQKPVELDMGDAYLRGVNDISAPDASEPEIADRVIRLAQSYRRQTNTRRALEDIRHNPRMDTDTGLFTRELFAAHLARLSTAASERNRPLSVCVLKIAESPEVTQARHRKALQRAIPQIGNMIARLVRAEDTAGRLSDEVFALALPATRLENARIVGERIAAVISCTAFESGGSERPFVVEFEIGVAELKENEPAAVALTRAGRALGPAPV